MKRIGEVCIAVAVILILALATLFGKQAPPDEDGLDGPVWPH